MVDNRGITPLGSTYFQADNASANKMSEEKNGQGGEYFAQEMQEEENEQSQKDFYQDRSAQLRASLNGLAMANAASVIFQKKFKEKKLEEKRLEETKFEKETENQKVSNPINPTNPINPQLNQIEPPIEPINQENFN